MSIHIPFGHVKEIIIIRHLTGIKILLDIIMVAEDWCKWIIEKVEEYWYGKKKCDCTCSHCKSV
jgi:hypothetical protein